MTADLSSPPVPEQPTPTPVAAPPPQEEPKPDPLAASVAAAIGKLRREAGLSERAAAKKLGTSQTQLRRMEDPRYLPSLRSLARVANAYGAHLVVSFDAQDDKGSAAAAKAAPAKPTPAPNAPPASKSKLAAKGSGSPSKGRRAAPGRARAGARRAPRRAAPRRKGR